MVRRAVSFVLLIGFSAVLVAPAVACVGARPYGMGMSFVGVADDANATYWNPAGLVQLTLAEGTYTGNVNARDRFNYQDYLAYASPVDEESAFAVSYIGIVREGDSLGIGNLWEQKWYWISYARKVSDESSLGINVRKTDDSTPIPGLSIETDLGLDFALLSRVNGHTSVGLLVQNVNEPKTKLTASLGMYSDAVSATAVNIQNWRPGIAYRPEPGVTLALSVYDATNNSDGLRHVRLGAEQVLTNDGGEEVAWRVGYVGLLPESRAVPVGATLGAGYRTKDWNADAAVLLGDFDTAFFLSAGARF